ncbi:LCP family protein [Actinocrispum sp. NPDC049592]|uniref:LCP family protein n=1 Tax=Actinocrispum sp. NPDC049592 TaxID=3154835 RepID=UPI00342C1172
MNEETLIRQAIEEEASQAVDPGTVLAGLRDTQPRRRTGMLMAVAGTAVAAAVVAVVVPLTASRDEQPAPAANSSAAPVPAAEENILLVGTDDHGAPYTDTMILIHRGPGGSFRAVSLPRDTFVEIPGFGHHKLNSAYVRGTMNNGGTEGGTKALVGAVEQLTGARVDHYAFIDTPDLPKVVNALGGVEVCLRNKVKDTYAGVDLPAGKQVINGEQALGYLRQRHGLPNGDLDRIARAQAFLTSLLAKVAGRTDLSKAVELVQSAVRVDPNWDVLRFANGLAGATLTTATIPYQNVALKTPADGDAIGVDPAAVKKFVTDFFAQRPGTAQPGAPGDGCVN